MNILHYTSLLIILTGHVMASSDDADPEFCKAVGDKDINAAIEMWEEAWALYENAEYLVKKAEPEFIVEFAKRARHRHVIIAALYISGSVAKRKEVFGKAFFDQSDLVQVAKNSEFSCHPEHFLDLLGRITLLKDKDKAINCGIAELFEEKLTECIDPLLDALKNEKNLRDKAIREVFWVGADNGDEAWVKRFYNHPAITPADYVNELVELVRGKGTNDPIFRFLLDEIDQDDLRALQASWLYKRLDSDIRFAFDLAIEEALPRIKPAGSRRSTWEKAKQGKEVVDKATTEKNAMGVLDLIGEYFTEEVPESEK